MRTPARRPASPGLALLRAISCVALGAGVASSHASVAIPFPFFSNFESAEGYAPGALASDAIWTLAPPLSATIGTPAVDGTQAVIYSGAAWLSLLPTPESVAGGYPVTWVDYYIKPVFAPASSLSASLDPETAASTGFVKLTSEGEVYAADGSGSGGGAWQATGHRVGLDGEDRSLNWLRISYRLDYERKRWDIFLDGKLALVDLGFTDDTLEGLTRFSLRGAPTTNSYFDYFYLGDTNPLFADENNDGIPDLWVSSSALEGASAGRDADPDRDGLSNIREYLLGLSPNNPDSDGDGVPDGREFRLGADPKVPQTYPLGSIPFFDGFESDDAGVFADGTRDWAVRLGDDSSPAMVIAATDGAAEGQQNLSLLGRNVEVERLFAPTGSAVVWLDFLGKLQPREASAPDAPANTAASFYVTAAGNLMAFNGAGTGGGTWQSVSDTTVGSDASGLRRYTVRLDYASQTWSLWFDGVRKAKDLGFASATPYFSSLGLAHDSTGTRASGFDRFSLSAAEPANLDNDGDGLTNTEEVSAGTNPDLADSDDDGILDPTELALGLDPNDPEVLVTRLVTGSSGAQEWQTSFGPAQGYTPGAITLQHGWLASGDAVVTSDGLVRLTSTTADASIERRFANSGVSRVWISFRAKLSPGALPEPASVAGPVSGMFGFGQPSKISVYDQSTGDWLEQSVTATASEWNDYILNFDYQTKRWLLVLNGKLVAHDLAFRDGALSTLARLRVLQAGSESGAEKTAEVDDLIVSTAEPLGLDFDEDGLPNAQEYALGTNAFSADSDQDTIPDAWEVANGLDPKLATDAKADGDNDGIPNALEYSLGKNPAQSDGPTAGVVAAERWTSISGNKISNLTDHARFPLAVNERLSLPAVEFSGPLGDSYGLRVRGYLIPPATGDYIFWISGDDETAFWLSPTESPFDRVRTAWSETYTAFRAYDVRPTQRSATVRLAAGERYYFEILQKESGSSDHMSLAWRVPGGTRAVVPSESVASFAPLATDLDQDGLPDVWEAQNGIDSGKGHGVNGAYGDRDGDGLTNLEEYQLGTSPISADSDGDLVSDTEEKRIGSNPTVADITIPLGTTTQPGSTATVGEGAWAQDGDGLVSQTPRASASFPVTVSSAGIHELQFALRSQTNETISTQFPIEILVDGQSVGIFNVSLPKDGSQVALKTMSPWLTLGAHTISLRYDGYYSYRSLRIDALEVKSYGGVDSDADGKPDWMIEAVESRNHLKSVPASTYVSPLFVEGTSVYRNLLGFTANSVPVSVLPAPRSGWFTNLPLTPESSTAVTVAFEGGAVLENATVTWDRIELFAAPSDLADRQIRIRKGSSLLLGVTHPDSTGDGHVVLERAGVPADVMTIPMGTAAVRLFDQTGTYTLTGVANGASGAIDSDVWTVQVVSADLNGDVSAGVGFETPVVWNNPALPPASKLEMDGGVSIKELGPLSGGGVKLQVTSVNPGDSYVVVRDGEGGAILDSATVKGVVVRSNEKTALTKLITYDDGSILFGTPIIISQVTPNTRLVVEIFLRGVTFEDGTTKQTFLASDFDELGRIYVKFLYTPSASKVSFCHRIHVYEGETYLGAF